MKINVEYIARCLITSQSVDELKLLRYIAAKNILSDFDTKHNMYSLTFIKETEFRDFETKFKEFIS